MEFYVLQDMVPEDVMLLDTYDQVFVWIGRGANEVEKKEGLQTAQVSRNYSELCLLLNLPILSNMLKGILLGETSIALP